MIEADTKRPVKRAAAATLVAAVLLSGCARTTPGQVAMTTEPLSPEMTCSEFVVLGDKDRVEVVREIVGKQGQKTPEGQAFLLSALATILCKSSPDATLKDVLGRMKIR